MTNINKWRIIQSRLVFDNQWCRVRQDQVELPNGNIVNDFFVNIRPDIALIFPITTDKQVIFVRQYRHGVAEILLEFPAGSFYPDQEDSLTAAARELEEETGYIAPQLIKIATLYDNPVKDTNKTHLFLAPDVSPTGTQNLDITEDIELVLIPLTQVKNCIARGEISVSGSIAALFLGLDYLSRDEAR